MNQIIGCVKLNEAERLEICRLLIKSGYEVSIKDRTISSGGKSRKTKVISYHLQED